MFWVGLGLAVVLVSVVATLLYALGIHGGVRDESYFETVRDVVRQLFTGDFW